MPIPFSHPRKAGAPDQRVAHGVCVAIVPPLAPLAWAVGDIMAQDGDHELIDLIAREQRGFRFILISGLVLLVLLMVISGGLAWYTSTVSQQLSATQEEMQSEAFDARRNMDTQSNRVSDQGRRLRQLSQDMRRPEFQSPVAVTPASALGAVRAFLREGRLTIEDERQIEAANENRVGSPALQQLVSGAAVLMNWERLGDTVAADATDIPNRLKRALTSFEDAARLDPTLTTAAAAGRAWVHYIRTASGLSNYAAEDCARLTEAVGAGAENGEPGAQPLWWQAQCERKAGNPSAALRDYALALERTYSVALQRGAGGAGGAPAGGGMRNRQSELTVAMNAYHGVGTTLIAMHDAADDDPVIARATEIAERACVEEVATTGATFDLAATNPRLRLAEKCLRAAMALRRRLGQTDNQISGSGENLTFAYLAEGNYDHALTHARAVERTGLFAWNELMRALSADHVDSDEARRVSQRARRNVALFRVSQFNLCELNVLLSDELYGEAVQIVREQHPGDEAGCATAN